MKWIITALLMVIWTFSLRAEKPVSRVADSLLSVQIKKLNTNQLYNHYMALADVYYSDPADASERKALLYLDKAREAAETMHDVGKQANAVIKIADLNQHNNKSADATRAYLQHIDLCKKLKDTVAMAGSYYRIAAIYFYTEQPFQALKYGNLYVNLVKNVKDKRLLARGYSIKSVLYQNIPDSLYKAEECYQKEIAAKRQVGDSAWLGVTYNNYGTYLIMVHKFREAEKYIRMAIANGETSGDSLVVAYGSFELGELYSREDRWKESVELYSHAVHIWEGRKETNHLAMGYRKLADALFKSGKPEEAFRNMEKHIRLANEIDSVQNVESLNMLEAKYQGEKNARELKILTQKDKLREASFRQGRIILWSVSAGLVLVLLMLFFIYRGFKQKKKVNLKLTESYALLEEKNNEILDSIHYARRIQSALLKEDKILSDFPFAHFVFFRPRDIVSGDFYWSMRTGDFVYVAVADCTGHGVPGALLTMLGNTFLNEIVGNRPGAGTAWILDQLRERLVRELSQDDSQNSSRDGMDISIIRIHTGTLEATWSGANNPLWIASNSHQLTEVRPDKQPIGYSDRSTAFTEHALRLQPGDLVYLFSDGYADQFGGEKAKKLKTANFKNLLMDLAAKPMPDIQSKLADFFDNWKGGLEQLDDVCVLGLRIDRL